MTVSEQLLIIEVDGQMDTQTNTSYTVKLRYNVFLGTEKISTLQARYVINNVVGYVISKYILTDTFCMEKCRDREEAYTITEDML